MHGRLEVHRCRHRYSVDSRAYSPVTQDYQLLLKYSTVQHTCLIRRSTRDYHEDEPAE
jgi:hypothetical protein